MARKISNGECGFCKTIFSKAAITKHLGLCKQRKAALNKSSKKLNLPKTKSFHILVEGRYLPEYWLHLSAPANIMLKDLDEFLRDIWLECCGHLSAFAIGGTKYSMDSECGERNMKVRLDEIIVPGIKFYHEYDFGSTTELALTVVSELEGGNQSKSIQLMARNNSPSILCESCGKIATQICAQCIYEDKGWFCDECGRKHKCGEEMFLPVVNSPRVGVCGYEG